MSKEDAVPGLNELGKLLKEARKRKGLSVQAVGEKIRVAPRFLEALEEGDLSVMPAAVYAKGFARIYASFLGLDERPLLAAIDRAGLREPNQAIQIEALKPDPGKFDGRRFKRIGMAAAIVLAIGILAGLAIKGSISLWKYSEKTKAPPSPFDAAQYESATTKTGRIPKTEPGEVMPAMRSVIVSVTSSQECWIQYQLDEKAPKEIIMRPGESAVLKGKAKVRLLIGNAGGVGVCGPGGPVHLPSKTGRVAHMLFTERGAEKLEIPVSPSARQESGTLILP